MLVQLEYAALDAVVLIHIFRHVGNHSPPTNLPEGHDKIEWKSYLVSTDAILFVHNICLRLNCIPVLQIWTMHDLNKD